MNKENERVQALLREAAEAGDEERRSGHMDDYPGLDVVIRELRAMLEASQGEQPITGVFGTSKIGRIVTDGWPLASTLGGLVLRAATEFDRYRTRQHCGE